MSSAIGGIIGGVMDMAGTYMKADSEHEAALDNAKYYTEGAIDERVAALDREQLRRTQLREALGQQTVAAAKSGVAFSGSVILALRESIERGEQDMLALKRQGDQQVADFMRAAKGEVTYARNVRRSGGLNMARGALNTVQNVQRSRQPTQRQPSTDDRINNGDTHYFNSGGMGGFGDSFGTSEGE